jgi:NAD dependent epimerase/dehydratase
MGRVLVTGADGFIGSHLTEALVCRGHEVRAFVFYNSFGSRGWLDQVSNEVRDSVEFIAGDVRDPHAVRNAVKGCDTVFHLAALIGIPFSYRSPDSYLDTNIKGTLNLLQAARELEIERLVHTSTSEVYGSAVRVPIDEEHPLQGQSPYSASKIGADQMALAFHRSFATPVAVIRPFNTYGPRQSARAVIPTVITQIAAGARRIRLGAVTPTRDFSYIADTVAGFVAVAETERSVGRVINIGSGLEISIGDTARLIAEVMGVRIEIETDEQRLRPPDSEVERLWADNSLARQVLGWSPQYGGREGLRRGLTETAAWFADPTNLARYRAGHYEV